MELREVTYLAVALRIVVAAILGGVIGLEREIKNRAAGLRTYMLVCVGACLVMLTNQYVCQVFGTGDPVRMGAQVVSGIGFLGAGTIIVTRRSQIKGLTTAAGLWSAAGVGLTLGVGFYEAALAGSLAIFVVMTVMQRLDAGMRKRSSRVSAYFELSKDLSLGDFLRQADELAVHVGDIQREGMQDSGVRAYIATFKAADRRNYVLMLEDLRTMSGVEYIEEL
ncbi:MAG: MgtC/SapB family protein [Oscillospiraceae bacterium]|nr:MgtC/SapB family protein [Oscillospiraceae bacterium]